MDSPALVVFTAVAAAVFGALSAVGHRLAGPAVAPGSARTGVAAGRLLAVGIVVAAVVAGGADGADLEADARAVALYGAVAIALQASLAALGTRWLLGASPAAALADGQAATVVALAGHEIAAAIVVAHTVVGRRAADLGVAVAFAALGFASLHVMAALLRRLTPYDDAAQIRDGNVAAAVTHAGLAVAVALLVGHAADGDFVGWATSLRAYGQMLAFAVLLWPVRWLAKALLAAASGRPRSLDRAVAVERDVAAAALEAATYVTAAWLVRAAGGAA